MKLIKDSESYTEIPGESMTDHLSTNGRAALLKAEKGDYMFPCKPDKTPLTTNGLYAATRDKNLMRKWWEDHPDALIGKNMGMSQKAGLDFDGPEGLKSYDLMCIKFPEIGNSYTVKTPRNGLHVELNTGGRIIHSANRAFEKMGYHNVDVKCKGGYFIDGPCTGPNGAYIIIKDLSCAEMSPGLVELLEARGLIVTEKSYTTDRIDRIAMPQNKIRPDFYPPCFKRMLSDLRDGVNLEHDERVSLTAYLYAVGNEPAYIKGLFVNSPDYDMKTTSKQVDHVTCKPYKCRSCATMEKWGYCRKADTCNSAKNPVWNYRYSFYVDNWNYETGKDDTGQAQMLADFYSDGILTSESRARGTCGTAHIGLKTLAKLV
jgi:hypothetical protein